MTEHRIYLIGESGRIVGVDDSAHLIEEDAFARAKALILNHIGAEVWRGADCIAKFSRDGEPLAV